MVIVMSEYFNAITGDINKRHSFIHELVFFITDSWYPLYDCNGDYKGAVIDDKFITVEQIKNKWSRFA